MLFLLNGVHDEFEDEVLALLGHLQIRAVEVDVPKFVGSDQRGLDDLVVIFLEANQLAVFVQSQEQHLQTIVDSRRKPVGAETHQQLEEDEVYTLFADCALKSHDFLQEDEKLLPFLLI